MNRAGGLHLEQDTSLPIQDHLDALTQKATLYFVMVGLLSILFITRIDYILQRLLEHLSPCNDSSCLALYEPASWSAVRWLSAVFLSILSILPFALSSLYRFAHHGLTQSERRMLKRWLMSTTFLGYATLVAMFVVLIPRLYYFGDQIHTDVGLTSQYDGISLFTFALSLFWAILVTYILALATITAGALRLITENNQDWWRVRILGFGGLVLLLSLPGRWNGMNIMLLSVMLIMLEFSIQKSTRKSYNILSPNAIFDHEGRRRFVTYIDCSCQGVAYPIDTSPENTGLLRYRSLCDNIDERDHLIDSISRFKLTDVIIGGCDGSPLPIQYRDTLGSVNCTLRGLNLLELQGAIPKDQEQLKDEVNIQLTNLTDPWSWQQRMNTLNEKLRQSTIDQIVPVRTRTWPEATKGGLRISVEDWTEEEIDHFIH